MRREAVFRRDALRRSLIGAGLLLAVNAAGCGESSVLSSLPDGGPASTGTGGSIVAGSDGSSGSGGASGTGGGYVGSGGFSGSGGSPGDWGTGGAGVVSPGWREGRMVGRWQGDNDALRITQCNGLMPSSTPFQLSITASPVDGTLAGVDSEGCSWHIRVGDSTASVAPGSTCRRVRGSDVLLFTVNELSLFSVSAWAGTVSGALTLTVTGPAGTQGCMVSMKGPITKEP